MRKWEFKFSSNDINRKIIEYAIYDTSFIENTWNNDFPWRNFEFEKITCFPMSALNAIISVLHNLTLVLDYHFRIRQMLIKIDSAYNKNSKNNRKFCSYINQRKDKRKTEKTAISMSQDFVQSWTYKRYLTNLAGI